MTRSQDLVSYILGACDAVYLDHVAHTQKPVDGMDRDLTRLSRLAETRGVPTFTIDLPALGKHFDLALDKGAYEKPSLPLSKGMNGHSSIPRLFQGLMIRVFGEDGTLRPEPCVHSIATLRQLYYIAKKLKLECPDSATMKTVAEFYALEEKLPPPTLSWGQVDLEDGTSLDMMSYGNRPLPLIRDEVAYVGDSDLWCVQQVFDHIATTLGDFVPSEWKPRHGPGAVSDLTLGKEFKFDFPTWSERLENVFPVADYGFSNYGDWSDALQDGDVPEDSDAPSRLVCVPKTMKGPRLIACEPTSNQWCQQILLDYFGTRIGATWLGLSIKLNNQSYNQAAARKASMDGGHWTVDLSSASDRVTCRFVERAFRRNPPLLRALNASRTPIVYQRIDKKSPLFWVLKKFSTMGSACTFPVESLCFLGLAISAVLISQGLRPTYLNVTEAARDVLVFGDDIVAPSISGDVLRVLLHHFDFEVNPNKTFGNGKFRESCGADMYNGIDVTPSYIQRFPDARQPESVVSAVATSNNFFTRGLWRTAAYLQRLVPHYNIGVVAAGSGQFGFVSYCGSLVGKTYTDENLQKEYVRRVTPIGVARRCKPDSRGRLLQYFTEAPDPTLGIEWSGGFSGRARLVLRRARVYLDALGKVAQMP